MHLARNSAQIYTDGSKLERIGIGISKSMRLVHHCSGFQAAIQAVVKIIVDKNVHKHVFAILSDSQAAIKASNSSVINSKTVYDYGRCLNEMANRYDVCITWVRGYEYFQQLYNG